MSRALSRIIRTGIVAGLALAAVPAHADSVQRVVDGDTMVIIWRDQEERLRLAGIDTPEIGGTATCGNRERRFGRAVTSDVRSVLRNATSITIATNGKRDRFRRLLGDLIVDGVSLWDWLVRTKRARRWPDGPKFWCR